MKYSCKEDIYKVIPNRYPFMILDSLEILESEAISKIVLKEDDWFFSCHYPGNPLLPGTLLIESMTQTFSAIFLSKLEKMEIPLISKIGEISIKESATIGDIIEISTKLESFKRGIARGRCIATKNGNVILEFDIVDVVPSLMIRPK